MTDKKFVSLLIVEDDEDDYVLTKDLLVLSESYEFDVEWISNAELAPGVLAENRHDLCLMDYQLGVVVGVEIVRDAINNGFSSPIIMLTGQFDTGLEMDAAQAGAVDYLIKDGLTREQLFRSIRYALVRNDIQKEREERERAEEANNSKTEFLANLSHEIRTPLTAIVGFSELLSNQYRENDEGLVDKLAAINRNSKHLLSLLNDTLDLSKIEAGRLEVDIDRLEYEEFIGDLLSVINSAVAAKGLDFKIVAAGELPQTIFTDEIRLRQILLNLLTNAVKFTDAGTITLELAMTAGPDERLIFKVIDTGIGIAEPYLSHIFSPYTQADSGRQWQQGTGLGLTISKQLANKLGGDIDVSSTPGEGSVFTLTIDGGDLSAIPRSVFTMDKMASTAVDGLKDSLSGRILVVDDVEDNRQLLMNLLAYAGCEVETANNGDEAVDCMLGHDAGYYQLILMDLNMPDCNGYQALEKIRKHFTDIPVIAMTAGGLRGERDKCIVAGFNEYISKPVVTSVLFEKIQSCSSLMAEQTVQKTVLVVEDNADASRALCELLELLGYKALENSDPGTVIDYAKYHKPDSILCDLNLQGSNGLQLLAQLHDLLPASTCILMSGESQDRHASLPQYIEAYIEKPITLDALKILG